MDRTDTATIVKHGKKLYLTQDIEIESSDRRAADKDYDYLAVDFNKGKSFNDLFTEKGGDSKSFKDLQNGFLCRLTLKTPPNLSDSFLLPKGGAYYFLASEDGKEYYIVRDPKDVKRSDQVALAKKVRMGVFCSSGQGFSDTRGFSQLSITPVESGFDEHMGTIFSDKPTSKRQIEVRISERKGTA